MRFGLFMNRYDVVNIDSFTENFHVQFYLTYLQSWPECCYAACAPDGTVVGYVIGKTEGKGRDWHVHVTAITICPAYRGTGLGRKLMHKLETAGVNVGANFCDLYVRTDNAKAIRFYENAGYTVFRRVEGYYPDGVAALDMRKRLKK